MARLLVNGFQIAADYCLRPRQADRPLATFLLTGDNRGRLQVAESRRTERFVFIRIWITPEYPWLSSRSQAVVTSLPTGFCLKPLG